MSTLSLINLTYKPYSQSLTKFISSSFHSVLLFVLNNLIAAAKTLSDSCLFRYSWKLNISISSRWPNIRNIKSSCDSICSRISLNCTFNFVNSNSSSILSSSLRSRRSISNFLFARDRVIISLVFLFIISISSESYSISSCTL